MSEDSGIEIIDQVMEPMLNDFGNKCRKRMALEFAEIEAEDSPLLDENDADDNFDGCPICFEPWTSSGVHRVCSLRCGHLFGKQCIETWLSSGSRSKCPQCNCPSSKRDIRVLFVTNLRAIDTSERDILVKQLEDEKFARKKAHEREAKLQVSYNMALAEINILKEQINAMTKPDLAKDNFDLSGIKYAKTIDFDSNTRCRCSSFSSHLQMFAIGVNRQLAYGKTFGIAKISLFDTKFEYIPTHDQLIKAICCSPYHDGTVLSTSFDKTLKLTSLSTNATLLSYSLEVQGWSCEYDPFDRNFLFAGLANGTVCMFDVRNTRNALWSVPIKSQNGDILPIHSISYRADSANKRILSMATAQGPIFATLTEQHRLEGISYPINQACISSITSPDLKFCILSTRGTRPEHIVYYHQGSDHEWTRQSSVTCKYLQPNMIRPAVEIIDEDDYYLALPDGPSAVLCRLTKSGLEENVSLSTNGLDHVLEGVCAKIDTKIMFGLVSERQLNLFT